MIDCKLCERARGDDEVRVCTRSTCEGKKQLAKREAAEEAERQRVDEENSRTYHNFGSGDDLGFGTGAVAGSEDPPDLTRGGDDPVEGGGGDFGGGGASSDFGND